MSCHSGANSHPANELEIVHGKKDELTVYCAKGSHAFYNKPGTYSTVNVLGVTLSHDHLIIWDMIGWQPIALFP